MAGIVEGQMVKALPSMMFSAACSGTLTAAKTYKSAVNNTYYTVMGAAECTIGGFSAACAIWKRGLSGNLKELAKECYGINNLQKAGEELSKSVVKEGEEEVRNPLSKRIGAAGGEVVNAISKIAATNATLTVSAAYLVGTACNARGVEYPITDLLGAAQMTATGLNTIGSIGLDVASMLATPLSMVTSVGISAIKAGVLTAWDHPAGAGVTVGVGAMLYLASHEMIKASESTGKVGKIFHGTMATIGTVAAVALPVACALS